MEDQNSEIGIATDEKIRIDNPSKMSSKKTTIKKNTLKTKPKEVGDAKKKPLHVKGRSKDSGNDESSSDELYLEDYSTESENCSSESDFSQEFSDEDKLMEYYEKKLREHCIVGNIDSYSSESDYGDEALEDREQQNNNFPKTNQIRNLKGPKTKVVSSEAPAKEEKIKKSATGVKNQSTKTIPSNKARSTRPPPKLDELDEDLNNYVHPSDCRSTTKRNSLLLDFGEPSCSRVLNQRPVEEPIYDPYKKVADYLNGMSEPGLVEVREQIGKRTSNGKKAPSPEMLAEEIHKSTQDHILKKFITNVFNRKNSATRKKNMGRHYNTTRSNSSESDLSGTG